MRKKLAAVLTMGLILGTSGSVYAANLESSETQFTCTVTNEPSYTVSIPSSVTMAADGTDVDITVTDVNNLQDGQRVSVTVAGTDFSFDQLVLSGRDSGGINRILGYKIQRPDGTLIESIANVSVAKGQGDCVLHRRRDKDIQSNSRDRTYDSKRSYLYRQPYLWNCGGRRRMKQGDRS